MKKFASIFNIVLSLLLAVGVMTLFRACGPKSDGTYMSCHYAQLAVYILSVAMLTFCVVASVAGNPVSSLLRVATVVLSVFTAFVPGNIIDLCMMNNMRCRADMRPFVIFMSILIAAFSLISFVSERKKCQKE